ncbi:MAG: protein kinase [Planctomycetes bacterium]|nr:protein kinase [Planctomycetota bacterium]
MSDLTRRLDPFEQAELALARQALAEGWLSREALREALLLREAQRAAGRPGRLVDLLERRAPPRRRAALRAAHARALAAARGSPPPPAPVDDEPPGWAERSRVLLRRPPDEDPESVKGFLALAGDTTKRMPPGPPLDPAEVAPTLGWSPDEAKSPAAPPRTIGGYEVKGELGRGGMGIVYRAHDPRLGRDVALKVLHALEAGEEDLARFEREARAAARVQHPSIVAVHAAGVDGGTPWLALQLVDGESLKARLARDGPLEPAHAARLLETVARALACAHEAGVLHRDLKPHNVLLDPDGAPLLADFGLARAIDPGAGEQAGLTVTGQVLGTPAYMAPEQAEGRSEAVDGRSDVYGLGATLYEALTGRPPFSGRSVIAVLAAVVEQDPPAPSTLRPGVPRDLEAICLTCLAKAPAARYPTAAALAADLGRFLAGEAVVARHERWPARLARRAWRRRAALVRAGAWSLVALAAGALALSLAAARDARHALAAASDEQPTPLAAPTDPLTQTEALVRLLEGPRAPPPRPAHAAIYLRRAAAFEAAGDLPGAAEDLHRAAVLDPAAFEPWLALARIHTARSAYVQAVGACAEALARRPGDVDALDLRAWARAWLHDVDAARADADEVLARDPGRVRPHVVHAVRQVAHHENDAAMASLRRAIAGGLDGPELQGLLALLHLRVMDLPAAERAVAAALAADPEHPAGLRARALLRLARSDYRGALADIEAALVRDPRSGRAHLGRASVLSALGRHDEALDACAVALRLGISETEALLQRAQVLLRADLPESALISASESIKLRSTPNAYSLLALALDRQGRPERALEALDEGVRRHPAALTLRTERAGLRLRRDDPPGALEDLEHAARLAPSWAGLRVDIAGLRARQGDLPGAERDLTRALELAPDHGQALVARGRIRLRLGERDLGRADLRRALELLPADHPAAREARAALEEDGER